MPPTPPGEAVTVVWPRRDPPIEVYLERPAALGSRTARRCRHARRSAAGRRRRASTTSAACDSRVRDAGTPFKATAGLHHAVRTGEQHGFLNLLAAATLRRRGGGARRDRRRPRSPLDEEAFRWRDRAASPEEVADDAPRAIRLVRELQLRRAGRRAARARLPVTARPPALRDLLDRPTGRRASACSPTTACSTSPTPRESGLLDSDPALFAQPALNAFMAAGPAASGRRPASAPRPARQDERRRARPARRGAPPPPVRGRRLRRLLLLARARREPRPALPPRLRRRCTPNWLHLPIGYHGRSGTVVVSGTPVRRPHGPGQAARTRTPRSSARRRGSTSSSSSARDRDAERRSASRSPADDALEHVFGVVLVNDWSARDLQAWEYVPLGPFLGKSFATSIAAWVTPLDGARPRVAAPPQEPEPLPHLRAAEPRGLRHRPRGRR